MGNCMSLEIGLFGIVIIGFLMGLVVIAMLIDSIFGICDIIRDLRYLRKKDL